jgi:hypothetical protein
VTEAAEEERSHHSRHIIHPLPRLEEMRRRGLGCKVEDAGANQMQKKIIEVLQIVMINNCNIFIITATPDSEKVLTQ